MPDRLLEEFVLIVLKQFVGNVSGEREHRQQQDAAEGVGDHLDNGEPDRAQAGAAGFTAITPKRCSALPEIRCLRRH